MKTKKIAISSLLVILTFSLSTRAFAGYYSLGTGGGGSADEINFTLEIGTRDFKIKGKPFLAGIGISFIDYGDGDIPAETIDSPCPHNNYTNLGKKSEGTEIGILGKLGKEILLPNTYLSLTGGITRGHQIGLVRSNSTKKYYEQSSESELHGVIGIGIGYFPELFAWKLKMNIQVDFDNRRGVTGLIGWCW